MPFNGCADIVDVFRMHPPQPGIQSAIHVVFAVAKHLLPPVREVGFPGADIPVPDTVIRACHGERITLLTFLQCLSCGNPVGNIFDQGDKGGDLAFFG